MNHVVDATMNTITNLRKLEVVMVVDNPVNWASKPRSNLIRPAPSWVNREKHDPKYVWGGHGISMLITAYGEDRKYSVLYDTGLSEHLFAHNVQVLGLDLESIDSVVVSHGHWDHTGGLIWALNNIRKPEVPVYLHPDMFHERAIRNEQTGELRKLDSIPTVEEIKRAGGKPVITREPVTLADGLLVVSGEIPRQTSYEKGFPGHMALIEGEWQEDEQILDDRCLIAKSDRTGLVVMTGCGHAGIVNTTLEAKRLADSDSIFAIIGGFHLVEDETGELIEQTIEDLSSMKPSLLVPTHCTGSRGERRMFEKMPDAYTDGSVGHLINL